MTSFRGAALTHEAAEDLFIGWLDQPGQGAPAGQHLGQMPGKRYSWLVAAGGEGGGRRAGGVEAGGG